MNAKLTFYYGTMNSSKTLRLLSTAYNFEENNIQFVTLKPSKDTRENGNIIKSRVGLERECVLIDDNTDLFKAINDYDNILEVSGQHRLEWILIDECQFLEEEQIEQLAKVVDVLNINVICFGLRTDFQSHLFPASKRLFELADKIEEVKSRCKCGRKTSINARFDKNGNIILDGNQILVGGEEIYRPICRKCFFELIKQHL